MSRWHGGSDLDTMLRDPSQSLDELCMDGAAARADLGIQLLPRPAQTFAGAHVAVYLRTSSDSDSGVHQQALDTVRHVLPRGAAVVTVYEENDTSAYRKKRVFHLDASGHRYWVWRVIRPRWQAMLTALRAGVHHGVAVANIDRLARDPRDLEDAIELAEFGRRRFEGVTGSLDLNTGDGRAMARVMVAMAGKASADTARRVKRKHLELAEAGVPVGAHRPFGWEPDRRTKDLAESKEIEDAVERLLAGETVGRVLADWQARGILTTPGNIWRWSSFVAMLRNPRLSGLRSRVIREVDEAGKEHAHWEIVTKPDGTEVTGRWEPILDRDRWESLIKKIGDGRTWQIRTDYGPGLRKHLLSGLLRCGNHANLPRMIGLETSNRSRPEPYRRYRCASALHGGCAGNTRPMAQLDALIEELVFRQHDQATALAGPANPVRIGEIDELLTDAYEEWKAKRLPSKQYFAIHNDLTTEKEDLESEAVDARTRWEHISVYERRVFIEQYVDMIIVHPKVPAWNPKLKRMTLPRHFDKSLIEVIWR